MDEPSLAWLPKFFEHLSVERRMSPFADKLGWRPVFDVSRVMVCENLKLIERRSLRPLGLFTMLRLAKRVESDHPENERPVEAAE